MGSVGTLHDSQGTTRVRHTGASGSVRKGNVSNHILARKFGTAVAFKGNSGANGANQCSTGRRRSVKRQAREGR